MLIRVCVVDFLGRTEVRVADLMKEGHGPWTKRLKLYEVSQGEVVVRLELQISEEQAKNPSMLYRKGSFVKVMP